MTEIFISNCDKCLNLKQSRKKIVNGYGSLDSKIIFVGLAPGKNGADITGIPFTKDPSGLLFQEALIKSGFSLEKIPTIWKPKLNNVYVTNLVKCNPRNKNGNNRDPTEEEIANCSIYLEQEIQEVKPKIIITLGKTVTEHVLNKKVKNFIQWHNKPVEKNNRIYIPFIHPSYVIRGAYDRKQYIQDFMSLENNLKH